MVLFALAIWEIVHKHFLKKLGTLKECMCNFMYHKTIFALEIHLFSRTLTSCLRNSKKNKVATISRRTKLLKDDSDVYDTLLINYT